MCVCCAVVGVLENTDNCQCKIDAPSARAGSKGTWALGNSVHLGRVGQMAVEVVEELIIILGVSTVRVCDDCCAGIG